MYFRDLRVWHQIRSHQNMFKNYLKIAIRNLLHNKGFSAINISGLAIGMASAMLILLWIQNQLTYDRWYPKADRIYQLYNRDRVAGELWAWPNTTKPLATAIKKSYADLEDVARYNTTTFLLTVGDTHLNSRGAFVDSGFVHMFDLPMLSGDPGRSGRGLTGPLTGPVRWSPGRSASLPTAPLGPAGLRQRYRRP